MGFLRGPRRFSKFGRVLRDLTDISGQYIVLQGKLDVISNPNVGYFKKSKKIGLFLETIAP